MPFTAGGRSRYESSSQLRRRKTSVAKNTSIRKVSIGSGTDVPVPSLVKVEEWSSASLSKGDGNHTSTKPSPKKRTIVDAVVAATADDDNVTGSRKESGNNDAIGDDSATVSSLDSLLSALSISIEEESFSQREEELKGIEKLETQLQARRESLASLKTSQPASCYKLLAAHEEAAESIKRERCRAKENAKQGIPSQEAKQNKLKEYNHQTSKEGHPHPILYAWWWMLFEFHHAAPAAFKLVVVCLCHLFFHYVLETLSRIVYHSLFVTAMKQELFCVFEILLGFCLLRANGYLWMFLDPQAYNTVKFDMHNRHHLGLVDAKLLAFLKSSLYGSAANLFGFYFVYVGLNQISSHEYIKVMKFFEAWYLEKKEAIIAAQNIQAESLHFYSWDGSDTNYSTDVSSTCALLTQHVHPCIQWWFSYCCNDRFQEWKAIELVYYGMGLLAVAASAAMVGVNVLEICDEE
jgi:hypothetical protein